jgi:hypothetical protein
MDKCKTIDPEVIEVRPGYRVACHLVTEEVSHVAAAQA